MIDFIQWIKDHYEVTEVTFVNNDHVYINTLDELPFCPCSYDQNKCIVDHSVEINRIEVKMKPLYYMDEKWGIGIYGNHAFLLEPRFAESIEDL